MTKRELRVGSYVLVLSLLLFSPGRAEAVTKTFCLSGDSTGAGWSWGIVINEGLASSDVVEPVDAGEGCSALADQFFTSLALNAEPTCMIRRTDNPCCFRITCSEDFQFFVGDAEGDPDSGCEVTNNPLGCPFNPTIFEVASNSIAAIPTLSQLGLGLLLLVLASAALTKIRRRIKQGPA